MNRIRAEPGYQCRWLPRRYQIDPWFKGREIARCTKRSSPKPNENRSFVSYTPAALCFLCQTPDWLPPHITGRVVNTGTIGWLGFPNERAPFRLHDVGFLFVGRYLSRTRNVRTFPRHFFRPILAQHRLKNHVFLVYFSCVFCCLGFILLASNTEMLRRICLNSKCFWRLVG